MSEKTETIYDRIRREAGERQEAERERTERLQKENGNNELNKRLNKRLGR
jgi:hypothetical protein